MNRSSQIAYKPHTFRSGPYLEELMAELDRAAISVRLAESRDQAGLTQEEMAEALQRDGSPLHWRSVQNYESPKIARVPWDLLDQWARVTGTTKEWLLHGEAVATVSDERLAHLEAGLEAVLAAVEALRSELLAPQRAARADKPRGRRAG